MGEVLQNMDFKHPEPQGNHTNSLVPLQICKKTYKDAPPIQHGICKFRAVKMFETSFELEWICLRTHLKIEWLKKDTFIPPLDSPQCPLTSVIPMLSNLMCIW